METISFEHLATASVRGVDPSVPLIIMTILLGSLFPWMFDMLFTYHNIWVDFWMSYQHFDNVRSVHLYCLGKWNMAWRVKSKLKIPKSVLLDIKDKYLCYLHIWVYSLLVKTLLNPGNITLLQRSPKSCIQFQISHFCICLIFFWHKLLWNTLELYTIYFYLSRLYQVIQSYKAFEQWNDNGNFF